MVELFSTFCMTTWLPFCRTLENPFRSRIATTSRPETVGNLGNFYLQRRDVRFLAVAVIDLLL